MRNGGCTYRSSGAITKRPVEISKCGADNIGTVICEIDCKRYTAGWWQYGKVGYGLGNKNVIILCQCISATVRVFYDQHDSMKANNMKRVCINLAGIISQYTIAIPIIAKRTITNYSRCETDPPIPAYSRIIGCKGYCGFNKVY